MRRTSILLAVIFGLVINMAVYFNTASYVITSSETDWLGSGLCIGGVNESVPLEGGLPFVSKASNVVDIDCGSIYKESKLDMVKALTMTPQFYMNWVIYSGLLAGIIYLFTRKSQSA